MLFRYNKIERLKFLLIFKLCTKCVLICSFFLKCYIIIALETAYKNTCKINIVSAY